MSHLTLVSLPAGNDDTGNLAMLEYQHGRMRKKWARLRASFPLLVASPAQRTSVDSHLSKRWAEGRQAASDGELKRTREAAGSGDCPAVRYETSIEEATLPATTALSYKIPHHRLAFLTSLFVRSTAAHRLADADPAHTLANIPNQVAGTWSLVSANITTADTPTTAAFGPNPIGILIFAPTLYFSELVSVDPATLPRFPSDSDRTSGSAAQNAAVVAGTLGQIGRYTVDEQGRFASETFLASTFPNWVGLHRTTRTINETAVEGGRFLRERLQDEGSDVLIEILWKREGREMAMGEWW
nr:hypothetical protein CFP56_46676 [Quercus suber]